MHSFTPEQSQILAALVSQRQVAVYGCAGSGKTTLAVEAARSWALAGERVLLLCRNPYLAESLRQRVQDSGVEVRAFPAFVREVIAAAGQPDAFQPRLPPRWQAPWTQFDVPLSRELNLALDILYQNDPPFETVIVDEGHSFEPEWWDVVAACLPEDGSGRLVVFLEDFPGIESHDTQQRFAALRLPLSLRRSCRSAGKVEVLVRQLHRGEMIPGMRLGDPGEVIEYLYAAEGELFAQLSRAILDAEQRLPRLRDVVVLSAESMSARQSIFAGYRVDSPRLHTSPPSGALKWRAAVLRYLQGLGLLESDLSNRPVPGVEDIQRVTKFCAAYAAAHRSALSRQQSMINKGSLRWYLDGFGVLSLRGEPPISGQLPPIDLLRFFGSPSWAANLPAAQRAYRLAPAERWEDFPFDERVRLVDLPAFSGLEAEGVIFVLHDYFASDRQRLFSLLYQAASRAKSLLYVISPFSILKTFQ